MKNSYNFCLASIEDLKKISEVENQYFNGYERAFDFEFLLKWYQHNSDMMYVVKKDNDILGFTILVPIMEELNNKLVKGEVSDLYDFPEELVCKNDETDYYYIADICVADLENFKVAGILMGGASKILYEKAKYITTSPITKFGLKMCEHLGFKKISEQNFNGETYDIYMLDLSEKKLSNIHKRMIGR